MWDGGEYSLAVEAARIRGYFRGKEVHSKEDVYAIIADEFNVDHETARGWTRKGSNGPGSELTRRRLAEMLRMNYEAAYGCEYPGYSDFQKQAIAAIYRLFHEYLDAIVFSRISPADMLDGDGKTNYDSLHEVLFELDAAYIVLPEDVYEAFENYASVLMDLCVETAKCLRDRHFLECDDRQRAEVIQEVRSEMEQAVVEAKKVLEKIAEGIRVRM